MLWLLITESIFSCYLIETFFPMLEGIFLNHFSSHILKYLIHILFPILVFYILLFGLVSLFNGISTLFRLFNAKSILLEEQ